MTQFLVWTAIGLLAFFVVYVAQAVVWRWASRRCQLPCPTALSWMVSGPLVDKLSATEQTVDRLGLRPGMTVVEIGPGPGRLLLPAARRVLPGGRAIGVELQQDMIDKLQQKLKRDDPGNLELIRADAARAVLPGESADVVYLCTVLGEIPDRRAALKHCYSALRPGGRLSITEIIGDPHYQTVAKVRELAFDAGFEFEDITSSWRMYTANFRRRK
jgi:ubiquinone/menaquinone biosynthesis C-methylase UbiE